MTKDVTGYVIQLVVRKGNATGIRLDIDPKTAPKNGIFNIQLKNGNYNAQYSLALAAAINHIPLRITTVADINSDQQADVDDLILYWQED